MYEHILKEYYNAKDTAGNVHSGFLAAMDFSGLSFPILNDVTVSILDKYVYNRVSEIIALHQWSKYLSYNKDVKEWRIDADFYTDFVDSLFVELLEADKYNTDILKYSFQSISAKDLEKITFGAKVTQKDYDNVIVTVQKGNDTEANTARTDTHTTQQATDTHTTQQVTDTHGTTARTDTETPGNVTEEHKRYPLGGSAYVNDTQDTRAQLQSEKVTGAQTVTDTIGARSESDTIGARSESDVTGAQTLTKTFGDKTTETGERQDVETIQSRIDNKEHTKHVIITPEKYFEIQQELANINAYTLIADAVRRTFSAAYWGGWM